MFCAEINVAKGSSTYKKLHKIGEQATRFKSCIDKVPSAWTTIYELSKLPGGDFDRLVDDNVLTPFTTNKQISDYLSPVNSNETAKVRDRLTISGIMTLPEAHQFDLISELLDLKARYNLKLEPQGIDPSIKWAKLLISKM